ncbi:MAG: histidine phosphatase family protein [Chloroflexota bacterium]
MELYIIRHAQSQNNEIWARTGAEVGRFPDPELTEVGLRQADCVGQRFAEENTAVTHAQPMMHNRHGYPLTHLYASLQTRAVQTGTAISKAIGLPLVAWEDIHEWGGIYEIDEATKVHTGLPGPNRAYFEARFPDFVLPDYLGDEGWWSRPHEERDVTVTRVRRFLGDLIDRHGDTEDRVGLVTHGGFSAVLLSMLNNSFTENNELDQEKQVWFTHHNTAVSRINFGKDHYQFVYLNSVTHLPNELIT